MARKTKAEAEQTRQLIIEAARRVFHVNGVSRTTFAEIAKAAGVTRGAIYWHFADKAELFFAMRDQMQLPLVDRVDGLLLDEDAADPLLGIERALKEFFMVLSDCEQVRQNFEIMFFRCEYVGEFAAVQEQLAKPGCEFAGKLEIAYGRAQAKGVLRDSLPIGDLALDTYVFVVGLMHTWLPHIGGSCFTFDHVMAMIEAHIALRRK